MRTALVVVDMLNDFVDGVLANPAAKEIIDPVGSLAELARGSDDWVVVYANDAHQLSDVELRVFPPHALAGTPGAAVVAELRPEPGDEVIDKRFYSAFTDTELEAVLVAHDVGRLVLSASTPTAASDTPATTPSFVPTSSSFARTPPPCSSQQPTSRCRQASAVLWSTCARITGCVSKPPIPSGRRNRRLPWRRPPEQRTSRENA
jgi:hypothetical protein